MLELGNICPKCVYVCKVVLDHIFMKMLCVCLSVCFSLTNFVLLGLPTGQQFSSFCYLNTEGIIVISSVVEAVIY